jgi:hypothetical protein
VVEQILELGDLGSYHDFVTWSVRLAKPLFLFVFETESHCVAWTGQEVMILLP